MPLVLDDVLFMVFSPLLYDGKSLFCAVICLFPYRGLPGAGKLAIVLASRRLVLYDCEQSQVGMCTLAWRTSVHACTLSRLHDCTIATLHALPACSPIRLPACMPTCHAYLFAHTLVRRLAHMLVRACKHARPCTDGSLHACMHQRVHSHTHARAHGHMHVHTHAHMQIDAWSRSYGASVAEQLRVDDVLLGVRFHPRNPQWMLLFGTYAHARVSLACTKCARTHARVHMHDMVAWQVVRVADQHG